MKSLHLAEGRSTLPWFLASSMGSNEVGDLEPGISPPGSKRRAWSPSSAPLCPEASVSQLPTAPCSVQALPPRWDLALASQRRWPLRAGLRYSQGGNDPIRSSPRHYYQGHMGKGFWMLYGSALWRASVLLLNHSRSRGKLSPFWWKKSVFFYTILSIPLPVKCTLPTVLHMGHMSSVRRALLLRTW